MHPPDAPTITREQHPPTPPPSERLFVLSLAPLPPWEVVERRSGAVPVIDQALGRGIPFRPMVPKHCAPQPVSRPLHLRVAADQGSIEKHLNPDFASAGGKLCALPLIALELDLVPPARADRRCRDEGGEGRFDEPGGARRNPMVGAVEAAAGARRRAMRL